MVWGVLIACGLVLWAAAGGIYAAGREIWPREMPEAVRLATAPALAAAVTVAHKLAGRDFSPLLRAVVLTLIVIALDALILGPRIDGDRALFRSPFAWATFAAILAASWTAGVFAPV
jgi:hypothetical protein